MIFQSITGKPWLWEFMMPIEKWETKTPPARERSLCFRAQSDAVRYNRVRLVLDRDPWGKGAA